MKVVVTIVATAVVVLFSMQNFNHVPIYYFGAKPIHIRLIFVIALSIGFGYFTRYVTGITKEEKLKKKCRELMTKHNKLKQRFAEEDDEEL